MEESEEEGMWEGSERMTKKGLHTGRVDDNDDGYTPSQPDSEAAAAEAPSYSETTIQFIVVVKEAVETAVVNTKLALAIYARGYLFVLVHWCQYQQIRGGLGGGKIVPGSKRLREGRRQPS